MNYTFTATVALLTAGIDVTRGRHSSATSRDAALLALVVIVILLAGQEQVTADIGHHLVSRQVWLRDLLVNTEVNQKKHRLKTDVGYVPSLDPFLLLGGRVLFLYLSS
ncbi:hypothetical protein [Aeromonas hydrophila]|uniref:hypothetical protein n=1 Tax=Aeromonas hydrophila TaxID=644 RepID=UPI002B462F66|nr:hypothetical protein [Aeromonas hydrophila]